MRSLLFFVVVMGIDIFLKSIKDKKKAEDLRRRKMSESGSKDITTTIKEAGTRMKRKIEENPSLSKKTVNGNFTGEGKSYREDHKGYRDRYEKRYEEISQSYDDKENSYDDLKNYSFEDSLYHEDAIKTRKKEYEEQDIRDYGREKQEIDLPLSKASTFKSDILNGIIFSEILGKPKSMQKRDI